ncbi:OPT oligopeptide transporter protein-domain-containing protein [Ilyonectria robusta]|uniref:OPT oligopeptide transporter protein-domain-containing protein n=1 Tax=Ilyonectria robusta TaxID=1079257 RepID=UPI001E8E07DE|nr:OPT oligopeptide transporter protein-domain-containing protein [Ilyonectria robusta]KAH8737962.1 OPT oligopeptide transporter protein-domain-containing protein [Ilyonectria robusta]
MSANQKAGSSAPSEAIGKPINGPSGRLSTSSDTGDHGEDMRRRIAQWGESGARNDVDDDQGSEYELLMDPHLAEEYDTRQDRLDRDDGDVDDEAALIKDEEEQEDSPYPEVRAAVRNHDEDLPCNTVRAWTIGLLLVVLGASMNTLFSLRQPSIGIGPLIAQIIAWPMGHGWAKWFPKKEFNTFGMSWSLNPGPFNIKEHTIIVVMASVSFSVAYATDIILAQLVFYKQNFGIPFQLFLTISTQSLGYGIAGMLRKFLVYPASMIWPGNLVGVTLMNAMYERNDRPDPTILGGTMHRYRWFAIVTGCSFVYYFIPGFLAQFLSIFSVATWLAPQNPVVNQIFGGQTGLSLIPITFDWTQIAGYVGSPLIPPWHAIANTLIGVGTFFIVLSSFFHYSGVWYSWYLPMSDSSTYDNTGANYNTTRILTPEFTLDEEAYKNYSPLFISTTFAMSYGLSFAAISSLVVYTYLHNGKQIWQQYRNSTSEKPDIHMKLMRKYKEAPTWWYMSLFGVMLALGFYTVLGYATNLSWWAFLLAIAISFGFALPIGIIQAITNTQIGLNVLTEFIYGYIQPGRPLALMIFKTFGYITMSQALSFVADLKFGHYMKIPPRTMFLSQVVATTFSCFIQIIVLNLALNNIEDVCEPHQEDHFTCPGGRVFFSASIIWGLLGPARMFSPGQIYSGLFLFFIVGAITPVIFYFAAKKWPQSPAKYLIAPLLFGGAGAIPPATPLNYLSWGMVGFAFQFWIKKRHFKWWSRLNFLTSSALDLGLALATLFIFFAFTLNGVEPPNWWGNSVVSTTMDVQGTAVQMHVKEGERFGPETW